jgi:hypothetical protein
MGFLTFMWPCIVTNFLIIKPTRCTNFSNLFLKWKSTCFGQFLCPSSGVFHCTHSNGLCHTSLLTACSQAVSKPVWHIPLLCVQWKTPEDGQRDCPKHVDFHSKNKLEKIVHLVGFIKRFPGKFISLLLLMKISTRGFFFIKSIRTTWVTEHTSLTMLL